MFWWILGACVPDLPPSTVVVDESAWTVRGGSVPAIRRSLLEASPRPGTAGLTRMRARVACQPGIADEGVADVSVDVRVEVALPRWDRPAHAPAWLDRRWQRFERSVRDHEQEHARLAVAHLGDLDARMRAAPDCDAALREAREAVAEMEVLQDGWDARRRGVRF